MSTSSPRLARWRLRVFAATWLAYVGLYFCRRPFYIVKSSLGEAHTWSATDLGNLGAVYLIAYALGQFVAGVTGNRYGSRIVVLIGMVASAGVNLAFGIVDSYATFAVFMGLNGMAQATGWSTNVGTIGAWFHRRERGRVMGLWATNFQIGGILASSLATAVLSAWGFRYSFFTGAAVLMATWAFYLVNQRNRPEDLGLALAPESPDPIAAAGEPQLPPPTDWSRPIVINLLLVSVFYFFIKFIRYAVWSWAPYLLNLHYGLKKDQSGYLPIIFDLAGVAGVITIGFVSDRWFDSRRVKVCFYSVLAMMLSCLALYLLAAQSLLVFAVSLGFIGFFLFGPDALMTSAGAIEVAPRGNATLATGLISGIGSMGPVLQELAVGRLLDRAEVKHVFATLLACSILSAAALAILLRRNRAGLADL